MNVVLTTLLATLFIQLGYFLWKLSAQQQGAAPSPAPSRRQAVVAIVTDWRWLLGLAATCAGWLLFVSATALGDISFVQPLMSAGDFLLVLMAVVFLKERLTAAEWGGVALTVAGAVVLSWRVENSPPAAFDRGWLAALMTGVSVVAVSLWLMGRRAARGEFMLALLVGLGFGSGAVLTKAMTAASTHAGTGLSWSLLLNPWLPAVIAANMAGLVLLQVAFRRGRAAVIVPLQLAAANALTIVGGVAVFAEDVTAQRATGIALIVAGTALLQFRPHAV